VTHVLLDKFVEDGICVIDFEPKRGIDDFPILADIVRPLL